MEMDDLFACSSRKTVQSRERWEMFSMNNSVSATGMAVTAKNTSGSLLIGTKVNNQGTLVDPDVASIRAAHSTSVEFDGTVKQLMPSQHSTSNNPSSYITYFSTPGTWSYKIADNANSYASTGSATTLTVLTNHVAVYDLWICIEAGSNAMTNLKANVTIQEDGTSQQIRRATRVIVATGSASEEFYNAHYESGSDSATEAHTTGETVLQSTISGDTLVPVKVYVYIDGEDNAVFTNNALNLTNTTVEIEFSATPAT